MHGVVMDFRRSGAKPSTISRGPVTLASKQAAIRWGEGAMRHGDAGIVDEGVESVRGVMPAALLGQLKI